RNAGVVDVRGRVDRGGARKSGGLLHRALHGHKNRRSPWWEGTQPSQPRAGAFVPGPSGVSGDRGGTVDSVGAYARSVDRGGCPDESAALPGRYEYRRGRVGAGGGAGGMLRRGNVFGGCRAVWWSG